MCYGVEPSVRMLRRIVAQSGARRAQLRQSERSQERWATVSSRLSQWQLQSKLFVRLQRTLVVPVFRDEARAGHYHVGGTMALWRRCR